MTERELFFQERLALREMARVENLEIVMVTSGHTALDARVFDKEAVSLAKYFPRVRVVATHEKDDVRNQVKITGLPPCRNRFERFLFRPLRCLFAARGSGPRVLIIHDLELLWWVPLIKLLTGSRVIYDAHEDYAPLMLQRGWIPGPLRGTVRRIIEVLEKSCAGMCDGIIGVTDVLVDKFHHQHTIALYNLPSIGFIRSAAEHALPLAERHYDLLHLGTLSEERLQFLIQVISGLLSVKPDANILIVGVRKDQHTKLTSTFPAERVTVVGKMPYQELGKILGNCRIGLNVHPVLYAHLRAALPVKIFEYMAAGLNIVTSDLPELRRLLGDEGTDLVSIIDTPEPKRFAGEIAGLLDDPELMTQRQQTQLQLLNARWNWELEEVKFVQYMLGVIHGKERPVDRPEMPQQG